MLRFKIHMAEKWLIPAVAIAWSSGEFAIIAIRVVVSPIPIRCDIRYFINCQLGKQTISEFIHKETYVIKLAGERTKRKKPDKPKIMPGK